VELSQRGFMRLHCGFSGRPAVTGASMALVLPPSGPLAFRFRTEPLAISLMRLRKKGLVARGAKGGRLHFWSDGRRQNEEEKKRVLCEAGRRRTGRRYIFKPADLPHFQTGADSNTYYLPSDVNVLVSEGRLGSTLEGKARWAIRQLGIKIDTLPAFRPGNGTGGRAFLVGYAFPDPMHLVAELVAEDGTLYPLQRAGGGGGPTEMSWNLWTLDSLPPVVTNYALRLKAETNGTPLAEIKFAEP
jgi:hypothetical protein